MNRTLLIVLILNGILFSITLVYEWKLYKRGTTASIRVQTSRSQSALDATRATVSVASKSPVADQLKSGAPANVSRASDVITTQITNSTSAAHVDAIILFCYDREAYLESTLKSLAGLAGLANFTVYVSQDGSHAGVASLIQQMGQSTFKHPVARSFEHWQHPRTPLLTADQPGHAWLSQHYKWGLDKVFLERGHSHAIIVEDDMIFSPDFLPYFQATAQLMQKDTTIWCASSWNDNGLGMFNWNRKRLFRTSYFPGLGWMMRRELWLEIGPHFPLQAWDHWMRMSTTSKGRDCVAPEVNRNKNIGEKGANMNVNVFKKYLGEMSWAEEGVDDFGNLDYLEKGQYEKGLAQLVDSAEVWEGTVSLDAFPPGKVLMVPYAVEEYKEKVTTWKLWPYPRGHQQHLTRLPLHNGAQILLADRRLCPWVPDHLRILPHPNLQAVAANRSKDCSSTCMSIGKECLESEFWFINTCEAMKDHFPCERDCAVEMGADIPAYVRDHELRTFQVCLITQQQPHCEGSHAATSRLCPCV